MANGDPFFILGFDAGTILEDRLAATEVGGTVTLTNTGARNGGCLRVNRTSAADTRADLSNANFPDGKITGCIVFYVKVDALPSAGVLFFLATDSAADIQVRMDTSGNITFQYAAFTISATVATVTVGQWHRVELRWDHAPTTHTANLSVDGGTEVAITATAQAANSTMTFLRFGTSGTGAGTYDMSFDDLVCVEGDARPNADYAVKVLIPDGDVDSVWTITGGDATRAEAIDERPSDTTTTYIESSTIAAVQRVDLNSYVLSGTEVVKGLQLAGNVGSDATTGTPTVTTVLQNAAGVDHLTTAVWNADIAGWKPNDTLAVYLLAPAVAAWSQAELDGVRLKFTKNAGTEVTRVGNAWAYVAILGTPADPPDVEYGRFANPGWPLVVA